jgi:hypothetical protein
MNTLRDLALRQHSRLRGERTSPIAYGRFYLDVLERQIWVSQSELAVNFSISKGHVSKAIKAARIPAGVVNTFGSDRRVSFRIAEALHELTAAIGIEKLRLNASRLGRRPDLTTSQVLHALAVGNRPENELTSIQLSPSRNGRYIRLDSPNIVCLIARLHEIQTALDLAIKLTCL